MEVICIGILIVLGAILRLVPFRSSDKNELDMAEDLSASPSGGKREMYINGVVFPLIPIILGGTSIADGKFTYGSRGHYLTLGQDQALAMGIGMIALGLFFHFHWFWGLHPKPYNYIDVPKMLCMLIFVICLGYTFYSGMKFYP
jgi:hypothetical protein